MKKKIILMALIMSNLLIAEHDHSGHDHSGHDHHDHDHGSHDSHTEDTYEEGTFSDAAFSGYVSTGTSLGINFLPPDIAVNSYVKKLVPHGDHFHEQIVPFGRRESITNYTFKQEWLAYGLNWNEYGLKLKGRFSKPLEKNDKFKFNIGNINIKNEIEYKLPLELDTEISLGVGHQYIDSNNKLTGLVNTSTSFIDYKLDTKTELGINIKGTSNEFSIYNKLGFLLYDLELEVSPYASANITSLIDNGFSLGTTVKWNKITGNVKYGLTNKENKFTHVTDVFKKDVLDADFLKSNKEISNDLKETGKLYGKDKSDKYATELEVATEQYKLYIESIRNIGNNFTVEQAGLLVSDHPEYLKLTDKQATKQTQNVNLDLNAELAEGVSLSTENAYKYTEDKTSVSIEMDTVALKKDKDYRMRTYYGLNRKASKVFNIHEFNTTNNLKYKMDFGLYTDIQFKANVVAENMKSVNERIEYRRKSAWGSGENTNWKAGDTPIITKDELKLQKFELLPRLTLGYKKEVYKGLTLDANVYYQYTYSQINSNKPFAIKLVKKNAEGKYVRSDDTLININELKRDEKVFFDRKMQDYALLNTVESGVVTGYEIDVRTININEFKSHAHEVGGKVKLSYNVLDTGFNVNGGVEAKYNNKQSFDFTTSLGFKYSW